MAAINKRQPVFFCGRRFTQDTGLRYDKLSKADWADVFCDLYRQVYGDDATPEHMMADAERRRDLLKLAGLR